MKCDIFKGAVTASEFVAYRTRGSSGAADGGARLTPIVPCVTIQSAAEEPTPHCTAHNGHHGSDQHAADGSVGLAHEAPSTTVQSGAGEPQPQNLAFTWHADPITPRTTSSAREGDTESGVVDVVSGDDSEAQPSSAVRLLMSVVESITTSKTRFGIYAKQYIFDVGVKHEGRIRDIFPLPRVRVLMAMPPGMYRKKPSRLYVI